MLVGLIADDLTGACDSAVPFLAAGSVRVAIWPCFPAGEAACLAVSTESRQLPPEAGFDRSQEAARRLRELRPRLLYRKVDSQMRGNAAADLAGCLAGWSGRCVFAPALPEEGRTTRAGRQLWPGGEADLLRLLEPAGRRVVVGRARDARPGEITVCDAATPGDLLGIAAELVELDETLPAGTAGLASALAAQLHQSPQRQPARWPASKWPLALVGTPAALPQARHARDRGWRVLELAPGEVPNESVLNSCDGLFLSGGETAARVLLAVEATGLELAGEAGPRIPIGTILGGWLAGRPVALKSGAFGGLGVIADAMERLARGA